MSNEEKSEKRRWTRTRKWVMGVLLVLLVLLGIVRWLIQSDLLFNYLRDLAEQEASAMLNGSLSIDRINGDLWKTLEITGVQLQNEQGEMLLTTDTLRASWSLLDLIRSPHELEELAIAGLEVHAEQDTSGNWNLLDLLPETDEQEPEESGPLPSWYIHDIKLDRIAASVRSPMLPDGFLSVEDLLLHGEAGYLVEEWAVSVNQFQFLLNEGRLEGPLTVGAVATAEEGQITLEQLLIRTGRSVLQSQAEVEGEEQITGDLQLSPLSWRDIAAYTDLPLEQDLDARLSLNGSLNNLRAGLELRAEGLELLGMEAGLMLGAQPSLHQFTLTLRNLDGPLLSGDPGMPEIARLDLTGAGEISFEQYEEGQFEGELTVGGVTMSDYRLDSGELQYSWDRQEAELGLSLALEDQTVDAMFRVDDLFTDLTVWSLQADGRQLNLAELMNDPEMESQLNLDLVANGSGFGLSDELITAELSLQESRWGELPIDRVQLDARVTARELIADLQAQLGDSRVLAEVTAAEWQATPQYRFSVTTEHLNLTDLQGEEGLPSDLNLIFGGEGRGIDPETLTLAASLQLEPGHINHEPLDHLEAQLNVDDGVATVTDGELVSRIAEAQFSFRQHLSDFTDPDNRLNLEVILGDVASLAPLLDVSELGAGGSFVGSISPRSDGELVFQGDLNLQEIRYDTLLTAEEVVGDISVLLMEEPVIDLDLRISGPEYGEYTLELVELATQSTLHADSLISGVISFGIIQDEESSLRHHGSFSYRDQELQVTTEEIVFQSPDRTLSLQQPFDLNWQGQVLTMDPLHMESPDGDAWLELSVPWLDETRQEIELSTRRLDVGTIQRLIMEDAVVEALFTAELSLGRDRNLLESEGYLLFEQIAASEGQLDSLRMDMHLDEGRLTASAGIWHESRKILSLDGDLPFVPDLGGSGSGTSEADTTFTGVFGGVPLSDQPVRIELELAPSPISYWMQFAEDMEMETDGTLSFRSTIEGTAGNPDFTGQLELLDGNLSGIPVSLAEVLFSYNHSEETLQIDGAVHSRGSQIVSMESLLPFRLDLETPAVATPEASDPLFASVSTADLNLAMFNDFLDDATMRDLRGTITGNLEVNGTFGNPEPSGQIQLVDGRVRVVPVAITLSNISSTVTMDAGLIRLESLSMGSGPGRLTAEGQVTLEELQPNLMEINLNAEQFQVANTAEMNAIIDLQSTLHGTMTNPVLAGSLNIRNGFFTLQNFGETAVEDVQLEDEEAAESTALYDSLSVDMSVAFNEQFFIRNQQYLEMEVELDGTVDLVKEPDAELQLFGSIEGIEGYAQPLGRNFDLEEAVVSFFGPVANPELNIRTTYRPPQADEEVTIWYIIEGTVEDPNFRFESEPELELQDIFSYTLFGRPFYALESWQQAVSGGGGGGGGVADVALDLLLDRVELLASQQLGIDVVQVETNRRGSSNTTTIKTGWYLSNRAFFAMLNEIGGRSPRTLFTLEYMLTPTLELILTQGGDNREGVDLLWNYDY